MCIRDRYNFKFKNRELKNWTYQYLKHLLPELKANIEGGAGQLHLTKPFIQSIGIPIPPEAERRLIQKSLELIDAMISHRGNFKLRYTQLKTALMQDLLTGEVRVTVDPES